MSLKQERMNERVRAILSELLLREVSDPRVQGVTVTDVRLDPELMYADIYVNALGEEEREAEVIAGLNSAKGFIRREVGKRIRTRNTPDLHFHWDTTLEQGEHINQLLDNLDIPEEEDEAGE
jgi:ribosome-binding factor A